MTNNNNTGKQTASSTVETPDREAPFSRLRVRRVEREVPLAIAVILPVVKPNDLIS
jgi:hypothetical protein